MRYFRVREQDDGELKIWEYIGRAGEFDLDNEPVNEIYDALNVISQFCPGPKKVTLEVIVDSPIET